MQTLSEYIDNINKSSSAAPFATIPETVPESITKADYSDVVNTSNELYVRCESLYKVTLYIPLKYVGTDTQGIWQVHSYNVYNRGFERITGSVCTRSITIQGFVDTGNVFKKISVAKPKITQNKFIFDFDCTLTSTHLFYLLNNTPQFVTLFGSDLVSDFDSFVTLFKNYFIRGIDGGASDPQNKLLFINLIFGSWERLEAIKQMFTKIGKNNLYIASRGIKEQIISVLNYVGLKNLVDESHITGGDVLKVHVLNNQITNHNVFYMDDDHEEHEEFVKGINLMKTSSNDILAVYNCIPSEKTYTFYNGLVKNKAGGISIEVMGAWINQ